MDCMQFGRSWTVRSSAKCFNTASGMDCMQSQSKSSLYYVYSFQYRKRYGLHAIMKNVFMSEKNIGFNTASGMDCMQ